MSSYNPNIPVNSQLMLQSQPQIRANFQAIFAAFAENHENLNNEFQGYHDLLLFREKPDPITDANQVALYTKAVNSIPNLFFMPNNAQTPIQLTYPSISTGSNNAIPPIYIVQQYTFLAGPFVVYGGTLVGVASGQTITMTPVVTSLLYIGLTINGAHSSTTPGDANIFATACATNILNNTFKVQFDSSLPVQNVSYFIIGQP